MRERLYDSPLRHDPGIAAGIAARQADPDRLRNPRPLDPVVRPQSGRAINGAESVLTPRRLTGHLPAETATGFTITQIYERTNQIQRVVMARQLLK